MGVNTTDNARRGIRLSRLVLVAVFLLASVVAGLQFFLPKKIKISFDTGEDAQIISAVSLDRGNTIELPIPLKPGAYFVGWTLDPESKETITNLSGLREGTTLYAVWEEVEKYITMAVNGVFYDDLSVFLESGKGLTPADLNEHWVLEDDNNPGENETYLIDSRENKSIILKNNFESFMGWEYLNRTGSINKLHYNNGNWTLEDENGTRAITDADPFTPPNYMTTFNAILSTRPINFVFRNGNGDDLAEISEEVFTAPQYSPNTALITNFSHWEIVLTQDEENSLEQYASKEILEKIKSSKFMPGEIITVDPLWYYLGDKSTLEMDYQTKVVGIDVVFVAKAWDDATNPEYKYSMNITVEDGVQEVKEIQELSLSDLSLENPVVMNSNAIFLYEDTSNNIMGYSFVDHNGTIHNITRNTAGWISGFYRIDLGGIGDYIFNSNRAIFIDVLYRSALKTIQMEFNYGNEMWTLPNYTYSENEVSIIQDVIQGEVMTILNGERYMKENMLFYGWQLEGDITNKIYFAGEQYQVPYISGDSMVFNAVWRESRLLYDFDLDNGEWEETPDFTTMKGTQKDKVNIISDIPVKFGYNFVGWDFNGEEKNGGDEIEIGNEIQTLTAKWTPKVLYIEYLFDNYINPNLTRYKIETIEIDASNKFPALGSNNFLTFEGWNLLGSIYAANQSIIFDADTVSKLNPVMEGDAIRIFITANQTIRVATITYKGKINNFDVDINNETWIQTIIQGEKFSDYDPFKTTSSGLDMMGREFIGWDFTTNTNQVAVGINDSTIVPRGATQIIAYATYEQKEIAIEYLGFKTAQDFLTASETQDYEGEILSFTTNELRNYDGTVVLPTRDDMSAISLPITDSDWGSFVGWALEKDYAESDPSIIYNVVEDDRPVLRLLNITTMELDNYNVDVDRYGVKQANGTYKIKLYAVYSKDLIQIEYDNYRAEINDPREIAVQYKAPIYVGNIRDRSVRGGRTIGPEDSDFSTYGIMVEDDSKLSIPLGKSFVGWKMYLPSGIDNTIKEELENKIWFPGEMLPSINFDVRFEPIIVNDNTKQNIMVGNTEYNVTAIGTVSVHNIVNTDIVVLPRGDYEVATNAINIEGDLMRVIIPSSGNIILNYGAIKAENLTELYIGDNLILNGSPVSSSNFNKYIVKKGYDKWNNEDLDSENWNITFGNDATQKYSYGASLDGLLVIDQTLIAVPSATSLTTDSFKEAIVDLGITTIGSYALYDMRSMDTIDLSINDLVINQKAIFTSTARTIVLPEQSSGVHYEALSGYHNLLSNIRFNAATFSNYASVQDRVLYFGEDMAKTHIVYIMQNVVTRNLDHLKRNLLISPTVTVINEYALASLNWNVIDSISADAEGQNMNIEDLENVPVRPIFVHASNPYLGGMTQTYEKRFIFKYNSSEHILIFKYGEFITIFDPKDGDTDFDNNGIPDFTFDNPWHKFSQWKVGTKDYKVDEVYQVGINPDMLVVETITFDASNSAESWKAYPVKFHIYDVSTGRDGGIEANIPAFVNVHGVPYSMEDILLNEALLAQLYLPGYDHSFNNGMNYQFIGWTSSRPTNFNGWLWNNVEDDQKILPNGMNNTLLNSGSQTGGSYTYYALYDLATENLTYTLNESKDEIAYYTVGYKSNKEITDVHIPYAKSNGLYMAPVMDIAANAFSLNTQITGEIIIGGAVSNIGNNAFRGLDVNITFKHVGNTIKIDDEIYQLEIGSSAFEDNDKITQITFPASLNRLGDRALASCDNLEYVYVNEEQGDTSMINSIGNFVFKDSRKINTNRFATLISNDTNRINDLGYGIFMNTDMAEDIIWKGILIHAGGSTGEVYLANETPVVTNGRHYIEANSVRGYAFANNDNITKITIVDDEIILEDNTFSDIVTGIGYIEIIDLTGSNVNSIADGAFDNMAKVTLLVRAPLSTWRNRFNAKNIIDTWFTY